MSEYCYRCKAELPAFGHDAICDSCDKMLEIYKQDEVIAELLEALRMMLDGGLEGPTPQAIDAARAAIAKEEGRKK